MKFHRDQTPKVTQIFKAHNIPVITIDANQTVEQVYQESIKVMKPTIQELSLK